jgi:hypothetical protein
MKRLVLLAALVAVCCSCQKGGSADPLLGRWALEQEVPYFTAGESTYAEVSAYASSHRARFLQFNEGGDGVFNDRFVTWTRKTSRQVDSLIIMQASTRHGYKVKSVSADRLVLRSGHPFTVVYTFTRPLE